MIELSREFRWLSGLTGTVIDPCYTTVAYFTLSEWKCIACFKRCKRCLKHWSSVRRQMTANSSVDIPRQLQLSDHVSKDFSWRSLTLIKCCLSFSKGRFECLSFGLKFRPSTFTLRQVRADPQVNQHEIFIYFSLVSLLVQVAATLAADATLYHLIVC